MRTPLDPEDFDSTEPYLAGTVAEAWERCLQIWIQSPWRDDSYAHGGRVNDFPPGVRGTMYLPSRETVFGRGFIRQFAAEYTFLLGRFTHGSSAEQICAYDLLFFLAMNLYADDEPLPIALRDSTLPVPAVIRAELEADYIYRGSLRTYTLGEVLSYIQTGGG